MTMITTTLMIALLTNKVTVILLLTMIYIYKLFLKDPIMSPRFELPFRSADLGMDTGAFGCNGLSLVGNGNVVPLSVIIRGNYQ